MDYKEKYEQAIEALRSLFAEQAIKHCDRVNIKDITNIFSELKESEDERIRKALIKLVKKAGEEYENVIDGVSIENAIAWLEKQDSYYTFEIKEGHWYKCVCDYMLDSSNLMFKNGRLYYCRSDWRLEGEIDERNVKNIGVNGYKSFFRLATNQEIKAWLEKQGESDETKAKMFLINKGYPIDANGIFPTYEEMYNIIREGLEKQGEQKPYGQRQECADCQFNYAGECKGSCAMKRGEQKPANKVEPKFHEGDWIVSLNRDVLHIEKIDDSRYYFAPNQKVSWEIAECDSKSHLWTIQDAKAGDVLFYRGNIEYSKGVKFDRILLFENLDKSFFVLTKSSIGVEDYCINANIDYPDNIIPATKEQKEILFMVMKDAGYVFDFEKKEFKKIGQNPAWSEEDESWFKEIELMALSFSNDDSYRKRFFDWLKSIKDRVQPKQEWSEDDKKMFVNIKACLRNANKDYSREVDWLKSLKPQNTWKPSKGQLECLGYAIEKAEKDWPPLINNRIYLTLKALKEQLEKI